MTKLIPLHFYAFCSVATLRPCWRSTITIAKIMLSVRFWKAEHMMLKKHCIHKGFLACGRWDMRVGNVWRADQAKPEVTTTNITNWGPIVFLEREIESCEKRFQSRVPVMGTNNQHSTNNQQPTTNNQQPATNNQQPTTKTTKTTRQKRRKLQRKRISRIGLRNLQRRNYIPINHIFYSANSGPGASADK